MMFGYTGELILRSQYGEVYVRGTLGEYQETYEVVDDTLKVRRVPGLRHWNGVARVQGAPRGLMEVLGEECTVTLSDGRTGKAFVTAYNEESAWVIEIVGAGPVPSLGSSEGF